MLAAAAASCAPEAGELLPETPSAINLGASSTEGLAHGDVIPNSYIVVFKSSQGKAFDMNLEPEVRKQANRDLAKSVLKSKKLSAERINQVYGSMIKGFAATLTPDEAAAIEQQPEVDYVEPDHYIQLNDFKGETKGSMSLKAGSQQTPYGIKRVNGGKNYSGNLVAWVIDTGIDLDHPDLRVAGNLAYNAFTSGADGQSANDTNGHGTHVAGTIGALNNSIGVIGVAAGVPVVPVKCLGASGGGSYSGIIGGVDHVGAYGIAGDVANMSLGGPASRALDDAVKRTAAKGIKFALAAGNESQNALNVSPGRVNASNVYTVSAMDRYDRFASFSNYGSPVDVCEPGVDILSTWPGGGYNSISGTSMASPHFAGLMLLGQVYIDGYVRNDPDGRADPIGVNN